MQGYIEKIKNVALDLFRQKLIGVVNAFIEKMSMYKHVEKF